jgi:hypothetical protein
MLKAIPDNTNHEARNLLPTFVYSTVYPTRPTMSMALKRGAADPLMKSRRAPLIQQLSWSA